MTRYLVSIGLDHNILDLLTGFVVSDKLGTFSVGMNTQGSFVGIPPLD